MIQLLMLLWLSFCYNTNTMTQELVIVEENSIVNRSILTQEMIDLFWLSIYDYKVKEYWEYLCAEPKRTD